MGKKHKQWRNRPEAKVNGREAIIAQLASAGFNPERFTEYELCMIAATGIQTSEIKEAIDDLGAMLEDYLFGDEGEDEPIDIGVVG